MTAYVVVMLLIAGVTYYRMWRVGASNTPRWVAALVSGGAVTLLAIGWLLIVALTSM